MSFFRSRVYVQQSSNSDYELQRKEHLTAWKADASAGDPRIGDIFTTDSTNATTYYIDHLTDCSALLVENLDDTNYVELKFTTGAGTADAVMNLPAGASVLLVDITAASNLVLTADTAAVQVKISYEGAA